ncbi:hypothetical protein COS54_02210 [Candidatus Shapirobacteria bacterium CG03_land_8_20_14_0_80_39_12]|uniref:LytR/CpsA/Psr regulator C-terminal domain-containing protein n=1 Tax=Candidatus Shapirobacteria bacterium CG03_land_8_20_14_0_80_39_12 TaxID=1974879 RepID=A0A2M7BCQ4_9BACT|nr:MAG: hypothetical protein COS54_02210 [Candidatus Shapirobacteria bacterium CG03_land_8_20_14_0_80_39_12]
MTAKKMKKNNRKKIFFGSPIFVGAFLVFLLLLVFGVIKMVISFKNTSLRRFSRTSFVLIDRKGELLIFSSERKLGQIYFLPAETVEVGRGFGEYEWRKIYGLGELEKKGGLLVSETIRKNLNIAIFGYFYDGNKEADYYRKNPSKLFRNVFWQALTGKVKTDLGKIDLFLLYLRALSLNKSLLEIDDYSGRENIADSKISEESLALEVLNATLHNGLAQEAANFLEKSGVRVIRSADALKPEENCKIKSEVEFKESYTLFWVKRFFPCRVIFNKDGSRADITVILGEDYWKRGVDKW